MAEPVRSSFHSDSLYEHVKDMVEKGSVASEYRHVFQILHKDGVCDMPVAFFLISRRDIAEKIRKVLREM